MGGRRGRDGAEARGNVVDVVAGDFGDSRQHHAGGPGPVCLPRVRSGRELRWEIRFMAYAPFIRE